MKSIQSEMAKGNKASGDLIPWTVSQQFNDSEFATLSGARIVRIGKWHCWFLYVNASTCRSLY